LCARRQEGRMVSIRKRRPGGVSPGSFSNLAICHSQSSRVRRHGDVDVVA
jgi:hypothetical protein